MLHEGFAHASTSVKKGSAFVSHVGIGKFAVRLSLSVRALAFAIIALGVLRLGIWFDTFMFKWAHAIA